MKRFTLLPCCALLALSVAGAARAGRAADPPPVQVVFVLDTTGSMGGLIAAAKEKIWSIANTLATAKPTPRIEIGLVGYRDRGDAYVTRATRLTDDLDAVYEELMGYQAQGGGDSPESVNQALHEAVTKMPWSKDPKAYRVIFLVGDCPPHMDYQDDVKYPESCKLAATRGILINSIQCGDHGATTPIWSDIARRAEGRFFRVEQSGGAILADTPFDKKLAALTRELDATQVYYGTAQEQATGKAQSLRVEVLAREASAPAMAQRAEFRATPAAPPAAGGSRDLVADVAAGRAKVDALKDAELPENLRKMTPAQRTDFVAKAGQKRKELQAQIRGLGAQRQAHLREALRQAGDKGKLSLDVQLFECLRDQAAKKGIALKSGPSM